MSKSVLNTQARNEEQSIKIETSILDPATSNSIETIFNIPNRGVIDKGSRLIVKIKPSDENQRLTLAGGIYAFIERATLRSSKGVVIAQSDKANQLMSLRNRFLPQETRQSKGVVRNGTYEIYNSTDEGAFTGKMKLDGVYDGNAGDKPYQFRLADNHTIEYQIELQELFPHALDYEIPVFILNDPLQLVITWAKDGQTGERGVSKTGDATDIGNIEVVSCVYLSDHLFFDKDTMAQIEAENRGTGFVAPYLDMNTVDFTLLSPDKALTGGDRKTGDFRQYLGLSDMRLKYMYLQTQPSHADSGSSANGNGINGHYNSRGSWSSGADGQGRKGDRLQLVINNRQYYPVIQESDNVLYSELEDIHHNPIHVPRAVWSSSGQVVDKQLNDDIVADGGVALDLNAPSPNCLLDKDVTYYGCNQQKEQLASAHYMGVNFSHIRGVAPRGGKLIGQVPIEIAYGRDFTADNCADLKLRCFNAVEKMLVIKNGDLFCTYA